MKNSECSRVGTVLTDPPTAMMERTGVDVVEPAHSLEITNGPRNRRPSFAITRVERSDDNADGKDALCVVSFRYFPEPSKNSVLIRGGGESRRGMWSIASLDAISHIDIVRAVVVEGFRGKGIVVMGGVTIPERLSEEIAYEALQIASEWKLMQEAA